MRVTKKCHLSLQIIEQLRNREKKNALYLDPKVYGMVDQVHSGGSIYRRHPHEASPTNIETSCQSHVQNDHMRSSAEEIKL